MTAIARKCSCDPVHTLSRGLIGHWFDPHCEVHGKPMKKCPKCQSTYVQPGGTMQIGSGPVSQTFECFGCLYRWSDRVEIPEPPKTPPMPTYSPVACEDECPATQRRPRVCHLCGRAGRKSVYDDRCICERCGVEIKEAG